MENKENIEKINFFKKVWYSITKFEKYPLMAAEGTKRAIKYLIMLTAIVTVFITIQATLQARKNMEELSSYIRNNIPDFSYENQKLSVDMEETILIKDINYGSIDRIVINTLHETEEQKEKIEKDNLIDGISLIFFKDEVVLQAKNGNSQTSRQGYTYNDFISGYIGDGIEKFNKEELTQYLISEKMIPYYFQSGLTTFIYLLIANILVTLLDSLEIAILGWITAIIARIKIKFSGIYSMAAHSLTLSMILNIVYIIINYFTSFNIKYFQIAYIAIAYIYLAAAIFILKDEIIKKMQEVEKVKQEQENVRQEIKEEIPKKKEKGDDSKDKNEKDEGEEPQSSEV